MLSKAIENLIRFYLDFFYEQAATVQQPRFASGYVKQGVVTFFRHAVELSLQLLLLFQAFFFKVSGFFTRDAREHQALVSDCYEGYREDIFYPLIRENYPSNSPLIKLINIIKRLETVVLGQAGDTYTLEHINQLGRVINLANPSLEPFQSQQQIVAEARRVFPNINIMHFMTPSYHDNQRLLDALSADNFEHPADFQIYLLYAFFRYSHKLFEFRSDLTLYHQSLSHLAVTIWNEQYPPHLSDMYRGVQANTLKSDLIYELMVAQEYDDEIEEQQECSEEQLQFLRAIFSRELVSDDIIEELHDALQENQEFCLLRAQEEQEANDSLNIERNEQVVIKQEYTLNDFMGRLLPSHIKPRSVLSVLVSRWNQLPTESVEQVFKRLDECGRILELSRYSSQKQFFYQAYCIYLISSRNVAELNFRLSIDNFQHILDFLALKLASNDSIISGIEQYVDSARPQLLEDATSESIANEAANQLYLLNCFDNYTDITFDLLLDESVYENFYRRFEAGIFVGSHEFWDRYSEEMPVLLEDLGCQQSIQEEMESQPDNRENSELQQEQEAADEPVIAQSPFIQLLRIIVPVDIRIDTRYLNELQERLNRLPVEAVQGIFPVMRAARQSLDQYSHRSVYHFIYQAHLLYLLSSRSVDELNFRLNLENMNKFIVFLDFLALKVESRDLFIRELESSLESWIVEWRESGISESSINQSANQFYLINLFDRYTAIEPVKYSEETLLNFYRRFEAGIFVGSHEFWDAYSERMCIPVEELSCQDSKQAEIASQPDNIQHSESQKEQEAADEPVVAQSSYTIKQLVEIIIPESIGADFSYSLDLQQCFNRLPVEAAQEVYQVMRTFKEILDHTSHTASKHFIYQATLLYLISSRSVDELNFRLSTKKNFQNILNFIALKFESRDSVICELKRHLASCIVEWRESGISESRIKQLVNQAYLIKLFDRYSDIEPVKCSEETFLNFYRRFEAGIFLGSHEFWDRFTQFKTQNCVDDFTPLSDAKPIQLFSDAHSAARRARSKSFG